MELKEFIKNSLTSIAEGVEEASKKIQADKIGCFTIQNYGEKAKDQHIDFDIAVVSTDEAQIKGGVESKILIAGTNIEGHLKQGTENTSRIKFRVLYRNI